ncbi:MAG: carbamoyltransferase C-terminal domain-containing protein [Nitrospirota bacterium]
MIILGLNVYHADSSACIVIDGKLVAAFEEERFTRVKHWAGFPAKSIDRCLEEAGITIDDVQHCAINRQPKANFIKKSLFTLSHPSLFDLINDRLKNVSNINNIRALISQTFNSQKDFRAQFHSVEHHIAHLASTFFVSPFNRAAVVSLDGFGDFVSTMWGIGRGNKLDIKDRIFFPHSLGHFYLALTQYLGFSKYGDEYKVMGLSAYGKPEFMDSMRKIVRTNKTGFELALDFFVHHSEGADMNWNDGEPKVGALFSQKLEDLLGPARRDGQDIDKRHRDIAASLQKRYEEVLFHVLNLVYDKTKSQYLTLAGGCAMNSVANGKIFKQTPFRDVYIQPAAGDAGGAVGAAYYVWNQLLGEPRAFVLDKPYLGSAFSKEEIREQLSVNSEQLKKENCTVEQIEDEEKLCHVTAQHIAEGKVVGWFQGRMEWGPRALGNRSIICDPRRTDMKDILNIKIKKRESFRPFAPSILLESTSEYFDTSYPVPFMLKVYNIRPEKREIIPAVTHVDGTGRLQTVSRENNFLYWMLIHEFQKITGVPVLLNTSFNENEPIVFRPEEALNCFIRTKMDVLVMGNYIVSRD